MIRVQLRLTDASRQGQESQAGFHLSTFDIPLAATADIDKDAGLVTFRFKYPDDETAGPSQKIDDDISIDIGKNSGKLLAIRVNTKRYTDGRVQVRFPQAIDAMGQALGKLRNLKAHQRENYG